MSTFSGRLTKAQLNQPNAGPSPSMLSRLLEDISGAETEVQHRTSVTSRSTPSIPRPRSNDSYSPSVWVGGGPVAVEARGKLRAADEKRYQYRHTPRQDCNSFSTRSGDPAPSESESLSAQGEWKGFGIDTGVRKPPSSSASLSGADSKVGGKPSGVKRMLSSDYSKSISSCNLDAASAIPKRTTSKRLRRNASSSTELPSHTRRRSEVGAEPPCVKEKDDLFANRADDALPPVPLRGHSFTERQQAMADSRRSSISSAMDPVEAVLATISSSRPSTALPQGSPIPSTPVRQVSIASDSDMSPTGQTPNWARPLHLIHDDRTISMNVHGEDWKDHPLCLYCFRQHGQFNAVLRDGCEVCGRDVVLEGHYWETPGRPYD